MRALIIDPGKAPEITTQLPNDEQGIARWLGGPVRMQPFGQYPAALLYTAPAGQDVPNRHYIDRWYYGWLIIVGYKSCRLMPLLPGMAGRRVLAGDRRQNVHQREQRTGAHEKLHETPP